jgi:hypothetical protein
MSALPLSAVARRSRSPLSPGDGGSCPQSSPRQHRGPPAGGVAQQSLGEVLGGRDLEALSTSAWRRISSMFFCSSAELTRGSSRILPALAAARSSSTGGCRAPRAARARASDRAPEYSSAPRASTGSASRPPRGLQMTGFDDVPDLTGEIVADPGSSVSSSDVIAAMLDGRSSIVLAARR